VTPLHQDAFSVVTVSDYTPRAAGTWHDVRRLFATLAADDHGEADEFIYVATPDAADDMPHDLRDGLPRLRVVVESATSSYELRNAGVRAARTPWVAMLDADCIPCAGWLARVVRTIRANPSATAISGRTHYPGNGVMERILALLSRAYVDRGTAGPTPFIAAHHCVFRRDAYLQIPLPTNAGVYSARVQSEAMLRSGRMIWFDPVLQCTHNFEGWPMERDIRRNTGHGTILTRQCDATLPYGWLVRLGPVAIPAIVAGKIWLAWRDCVRCHSHYNVTRLQLPLALAVAVWVHLLEIGGMWTAFRRRPLANTAYF
jgi:hypothetical protein